MGWKSLEARQAYLANPKVRQRQNVLQRQRRSSLSYKKKQTVWAHDWYIKNKDKVKSNVKQWQKTNPKKRLKIVQKYANKHGVNKWLLSAWSKAILHRDSKICQICGKPAAQAHHIIWKILYPQLALNENNGIALCDNCHYEAHGRCLN